MRKRARIDANQPEIVAALRAVGASVQSLATIGDGCPDLLVGFRDKNYLLELKDSSQPPNKRQLTHDELRWHMDWNGGLVKTVYTPQQALQAIGAVK